MILAEFVFRLFNRVFRLNFSNNSGTNFVFEMLDFLSIVSFF